MFPISIWTVLRVLPNVDHKGKLVNIDRDNGGWMDANLTILAISNGLGNISSVTRDLTQSVENGRGLLLELPLITLPKS